MALRHPGRRGGACPQGQEGGPAPGGEGYILGRFVIAVLERMGDDLTRESFMVQALTSGPFAIDDWAVGFTPGTNTGSTYTRLTHFGERRQGQ